MNEILSILNEYPFLNPIAIVLGSVILAVVVNFITGTVLKQQLKKTDTEADDEILKLVKTPIFWSIFLGGIYFAIVETHLLSPEYSEILRKTLGSVSFVIWGTALLKITTVVFKEIEQKAKQKGDVNKTDVIPFLETITRLVLAALALVAILNQWNIDLRPLFTSAGIAGLAIAFAAKDVIANLFGGISIFFDKPYKTGDFVYVDNTYRGKVTEIGLRSTKIQTGDNVLLTVPNSVMVTGAVVNETGFDPKIRISIPVGVAYGTDLEKLEKLIIELLDDHPDVLVAPEPFVRFTSFGDSAIMLEVYAVVASPEEMGNVKSKLIKLLNKKFENEGVKIPYPQLDVHNVQE